MNFTEEQIKSLSDHLMIHMKPVIENTIDIKVNGKINRLDEKIDKYIGTDIEWKEHDAKWKEEMKEMQKVYEGSKSFFSGSKKVFGWITALAATVGSIIFLHDKIK